MFSKFTDKQYAGEWICAVSRWREYDYFARGNFAEKLVLFYTARE